MTPVIIFVKDTNTFVALFEFSFSICYSAETIYRLYLPGILNTRDFFSIAKTGLHSNRFAIFACITKSVAFCDFRGKP